MYSSHTHHMHNRTHSHTLVSTYCRVTGRPFQGGIFDLILEWGKEQFCRDLGAEFSRYKVILYLRMEEGHFQMKKVKCQSSKPLALLIPQDLAI